MASKNMYEDAFNLAGLKKHEEKAQKKSEIKNQDSFVNDPLNEMIYKKSKNERTKQFTITMKEDVISREKELIEIIKKLGGTYNRSAMLDIGIRTALKELKVKK